MKNTHRQPIASRTLRLAALQAASMVLAAGAQAQSSGCTQFRDTLASRVDPSIRGFTLDIVPSGAATPSGAKVFGTCDGGAYKILFRRGGNTRPTPGEGGTAAAPPPASMPTPAPAPVPKPAERVAPAAPAPAPAPPAPVPAPQPVARAPEPAPAVPAPPPAPRAEPETAASSDGSAPTPVLSEASAADFQDMGFWATYWRWICVLLAVPLAAWAWAWYVHHRAYDDAGLPRGPRL